VLDRLAEERRLRTVALVYPGQGRWWLEVWAGTRAGIAPLGTTSDPAEVTSLAAHLVGTDAVHVENLHGLPLDLIPVLESNGLKTVLSIHDFVLFCRRPHLIDAATGGFCEYSRSESRCTQCLRVDDIAPGLSQSEYRRLCGGALRSVRAAVFPSAFMQLRHRELFPSRRPDQQETVIAPAAAGRGSFRRGVRSRSRIAFVGGVYHHKGGSLIAEIMAGVRSHLAEATGIVYGAGDQSLLNALHRERGLRVRGYYSPGYLPSLLTRDRVAVAVLPSIWPEAYAIVVDECLAAGVPVVALDHGAVGARLRDLKGGHAVAPGSGGAGLAAAIVEWLGNETPVPLEVMRALPTPMAAATAHVRLYETLGFSREGAGS
jgi:glycosyltransferase involved in cell wall biosynthesis